MKFTFFAKMNKYPISYKEALETAECEQQRRAVKKEFNSMEENKGWKLVDRPLIMKDGKKTNIIDSK